MSQNPLEFGVEKEDNPEFGVDKEDTPEDKNYAIPCHKTPCNLVLLKKTTQNKNPRHLMSQNPLEFRVDKADNPEQKIHAIPCHKTPLEFGGDKESNPEQQIHAIPCHKTPWNVVLIKKTTQNKKSTPSHVTKPPGIWCW